MALIQCPECNKSISDKAAACPGCGMPISSRPTEVTPVGPPRQQVPTVIEQTGKTWKALQVGGAASAIIGAAPFFIAINMGPRDADQAMLAVLGVILVFGGIIAYIVGKLGGWWKHG